jgi:hypothetical protein
LAIAHFGRFRRNHLGTRIDVPQGGSTGTCFFRQSAISPRPRSGSCLAGRLHGGAPILGAKLSTALTITRWPARNHSDVSALWGIGGTRELSAAPCGAYRLRQRQADARAFQPPHHDFSERGPLGRAPIAVGPTPSARAITILVIALPSTATAARFSSRSPTNRTGLRLLWHRYGTDIGGCFWLVHASFSALLPGKPTA